MYVRREGRRNFSRSSLLRAVEAKNRRMDDERAVIVVVVVVGGSDGGGDGSSRAFLGDALVPLRAA